ncbi:NAD(P)H-binding protein [Streptomyces sp. NPDC050560]|uniref:NAD(P)H-binding protein n=1 Tax=Streptomyces sp. NPDC050560 TaxID=3365630 RepID=UPI00378BC484
MAAADLDRPETLPPVLEGADRVFLYARPEGAAGFAAAARAAGVRHLVLLSSAAVAQKEARGPIADAHRAVEDAIEDSGIPRTFIRPGMFATNALWWWREPVRAGRPVLLPYPLSRTAPVHEKDMAALAVHTLTHPGHEGRAYTVFGPEGLTLLRQVELIGAALGRELTVETVSPDEGRAELARTMPELGVSAVLGAWEAGVRTDPATSTVIEDVTGRPARTFARWAEDHAADFR